MFFCVSYELKTLMTETYAPQSLQIEDKFKTL